APAWRSPVNLCSAGAAGVLWRWTDGVVKAKRGHCQGASPSPPGQTRPCQRVGPASPPKAWAVATKETVAAYLIHVRTTIWFGVGSWYQRAACRLLSIHATPATDKPLVKDDPSALALRNWGA